jgi:hypothetical protein
LLPSTGQRIFLVIACLLGAIDLAVRKAGNWEERLDLRQA